MSFVMCSERIKLIRPRHFWSLYQSGGALSLSPALFLNKLGAALGAIEDGSNFPFFSGGAKLFSFGARAREQKRATNQLWWKDYFDSRPRDFCLCSQPSQLKCLINKKWTTLAPPQEDHSEWLMFSLSPSLPSALRRSSKLLLRAVAMKIQNNSKHSPRAPAHHIHWNFYAIPNSDIYSQACSL